ncbi:methyltransferase [Candidatus Protochlamydia sp. W-9]|uniref:methyltransferase n=1 Tax=Candidatus Protochlamydia sp. W-9 TaxID=1785087 RepID=UPI0013013BDB|nr:methyltransferase [Candidatus Protochlamydia sp. W-9]
MIIICFLFSLFFILIHIFWYSYFYGITPTPTSLKVQKSMVALLPKQLNGKVVELGSGWGNLTVALAQSYPEKEIIAYEISPIPYYVSKFFFYLIGLKKIKTYRKDFFKCNFKDSGIIICYLYSNAMQKLKVKFEQELRAGTYVLSHTFAIPGWKPIQIYYAKDIYKTPVFLYCVQETLKYGI